MYCSTEDLIFFFFFRRSPIWFYLYLAGFSVINETLKKVKLYSLQIDLHCLNCNCQIAVAYNLGVLKQLGILSKSWKRQATECYGVFFPDILMECSEVLYFCLAFNGAFPWQFSSISLGQCSWWDVHPNYVTQKNTPSQVTAVFWRHNLMVSIHNSASLIIAKEKSNTFLA